MADSLAYVFREVPELGGVYAITASENLTNCASHGRWQLCEHCKTRTDTDILAEVVATIDEGVHRSSPKAKVIVSDWGWKGHGDARDIIARLPKSGLAYVGQRMGLADRAWRNKDQDRRILDLRRWPWTASPATLEGRRAGRSQNGG